MATRKRKLPGKRKPVAKEPGFVVLAAHASMRLVTRNSGAVVGTLGFLVVFSCVTANAFWYQQGRHPSPFFRTRDPHNFSAMPGVGTSSAIKPNPDDVTTFLIQRQGQVVEEQAAVAQPAAVPQQAASARSAEQQTILSIQTQLARLGFYNGPLNGRRDAQTDAAISAYQQRIGLSGTSQPSDDLLTVLAADDRSTASPTAEQASAVEPAAVEPAVVSVHPLERPTMVKLSNDNSIDPVAAAIRSAEKNIVKPPATKVSVAVPVPRIAVGANQSTGSVDTTVSAGLVMDIQRGLINVAYTGIKVDGVVGEKTKAAIRHFQRHYRLPETGEPDMAVLKTLKSIGAL